MSDNIFLEKCRKEWQKLKKALNQHKIRRALGLPGYIDEITWQRDLAFLYTTVEKNLFIVSGFKEQKQEKANLKNLRQRVISFLKSNFPSQSDHAQNVGEWHKLLSDIESKSGFDSDKAKFILAETNITTLQQALEKHPENAFLHSELSKAVNDLGFHIDNQDNDPDCSWEQLQTTSQEWLQAFDVQHGRRLLGFQRNFEVTQYAVRQTSDPLIKFFLCQHIDINSREGKNLHKQFQQKLLANEKEPLPSDPFAKKVIKSIINHQHYYGKYPIPAQIYVDIFDIPTPLEFDGLTQDQFNETLAYKDPSLDDENINGQRNSLGTSNRNRHATLAKQYKLFVEGADRYDIPNILKKFIERDKKEETVQTFITSHPKPTFLVDYTNDIAAIQEEIKQAKEKEKAKKEEADKLWDSTYEFHQLKEKCQGIAELLKRNPTHFAWYKEAGTLLNSDVAEELSDIYDDADLNSNISNIATHLGKTPYYSSRLLWGTTWEYLLENDLPQHVQYKLPKNISSGNKPSDGPLAFQQTQQRIEQDSFYSGYDLNNELDIPYQRIRGHFAMRMRIHPSPTFDVLLANYIPYDPPSKKHYINYYKLNSVLKKVFFYDIGFISQPHMDQVNQIIDKSNPGIMKPDHDMVILLSQADLKDIVLFQNHLLEDIKSSYLKQHTANFPSYNFDQDLQTFQRLFSGNHDYNDNYFLYCILDRYADSIEKIGTKEQKTKLASWVKSIQLQHDLSLFYYEECWNRQVYYRSLHMEPPYNPFGQTQRLNSYLKFTRSRAKELVDSSPPAFLAERQKFLDKMTQLSSTQETNPQSLRDLTRSKYTRWRDFMTWYYENYMEFSIDDPKCYPQFLEHVEKWQQHLTPPSQGLEKVKQLLHQNVTGVELEAVLEETGLESEARLKLQTKITQLQREGKKPDAIFNLIKNDFNKISNSQTSKSNMGGFVPDQTAKRLTIHKPASGFTTNDKRRFYSFDAKIFDPSKQPILIGNRYHFNPAQPSMRVDKPGLQLREKDIKEQGAVVVLIPGAVWAVPNPQTLYPSNQQHFEVKQPDRANDLAATPIEFTPKVPNEQTQQIQASQTAELLLFYLVTQQTMQASQKTVRNQGQVISLSFGQGALRKAAGDGVSYTSSSRYQNSTTKGTAPQGNLVSFSQIIASQKNTTPRSVSWYTKGATLYSGGSQVTAGATFYIIAQAAGETPRSSENWGLVGAGIADSFITWGKSLNDIGLPVLSTMYLSTHAAVSHALTQAPHVIKTLTTPIIKGVGSALKTTGIIVTSTSLEAAAPVIIIPATIGLGMFAISKIPLEHATNRDQFYTLYKAGVLPLNQVHALLDDDNKPYIILPREVLYPSGLDYFLNDTLSLGKGGQVFHRKKDGRMVTLHTKVPISAPKIMPSQNQTSMLTSKK